MPDSVQSTHPGPYIKERVIPKTLSVKKAAELLGIGRPALSNLLNANAALTADMAPPDSEVLRRGCPKAFGDADRI